MALILQIAAEAGCFSTILAAVNAVNLPSALEGDVAFTVFASIDDTFAALPSGTLQTLEDNPAQLAGILKYHVVPELFPQNEVVTKQEWLSLEGVPIPNRRCSPFEVKNATLVKADILCDNGFVHVIDRVISPG
jgi:uncharacterized surface protein with fasciclin (FAS1) repeats